MIPRFHKEREETLDPAFHLRIAHKCGAVGNSSAHTNQLAWAKVVSTAESQMCLDMFNGPEGWHNQDMFIREL